MAGMNDRKKKKKKREHASVATCLKSSNQQKQPSKKRSPNSIAAAEIGFIDLTGEEAGSGFDGDRESKLGSVRRKLQSSSSVGKRRKGTGGMKTTGLDIRVDGDDNDVIVLDSSDDENDAYNDNGGDDILAVYTDVDEDVDEDADEDADGGATVDDDATSAIPVKEIAQAAATSKASKEFQVKIEGKTSSSSSAKLKQKDGKTMADNNNNNNNNNDVNDDVEIVEAAAKKLTMVAESTSKKASTIGKIDDDDDVRVEGVLNETRFSHMRQHCTSFPFRPGTPNNLQIANREYCEKCYCYVCDSLAKDCKQWHSPFSSDPYQNHCCASEKNVVWEEMRSRAKVAKMRNAPNGNEKRDDGPPHGCHFSADCFDGLYVLNSGNPGNCLRCWCYICDKQVFYCDDYNHVQHHPGSDYARKERQKRKLSTFGVPGPFEPTNPDAPKDTSLTQCRRCSWFVRFDSKRSCTPSFSDWCPHCGRVASEDDLEKNQQATTSAASDTKNVVHEQQPYVVGEKEIPFRIVAHDPRLFEDFKDNWEDAGDSTSSPEWYYDEAERQEEVFLHRIGRAPKWSNVFRALPLVAEKNVPRTSSSLWKYNGVVKDSSDAVIIDDPQQYQLLCYIAKVAGTNEEADTWFKIHATWHKESKLGTFKLQFMVPKDAFLGQNNVSRHRFKHYVSGILGLWFGIFPLQVSELSGLLNPSSAEDIINEMELKCRMNRHIRNIPISIKPFEVEVIEDGILPVIRKSLESRLASLRNGKDENDSRLTLAPSDVSNINVDVSTSGRSSDPFRDSLVRYFSEQFASKIHRVDWKCLSDLVANSFGAIARAECPNFLEPVLGFESMITAEICYLKDIKAKGLFRLPPSIQRTMIQLENLGHEAEDCVEGLTIELLEFQRQSLRWALERERIPGGIQSYHWLKLPNRGEEYQDDIYYNPLLKLFRKDKPAVIRGGFIAEQMGLGKTVISLALILKNPAPEFPLSGNPISALKQNIPSGISSNIVTSDNIGWENNLYEKTSIINKQKGSTICRGTLVICPVSLVGQWIAEAKSKLKEPGLVYPYHGAKRTRDSKILAANSIVVTTYSTIASDAVYHARQSFDTNYCPPLEKIRWWRIICDEGHCLRTAGTGHSKAVLSLVADHKWIVSGTPMNTSYGDLKNQLKFLGFEHLEKTFIAMNYNITRHNKPMHDMSLITYFLRPIMMRHSHKQKYRGTSTTLMSLPPKTERKEIVKFTASEKKEFAKIEKEAQDWYLKFRSANLTKMSKHFLKISSRLIPLRVACSGGNYPVYLEDHNPEDEKDTGITDVNTDGDENIKKKTKKNTVYSKFVFTSKFKTLLAKLESIKTNEPDSKSLVFSQFSSTLAWLKNELPKHGFEFRTLSGDMSMKKRAQALAEFQNDPPTTIFLLSMRAGAVGINLTQANRVFLMEPSFNPALEAQAIGRIHRLGQKRAVEIVRLVVKDSFEERMVQFLEKKYCQPPAGSTDEPSEGDGKKKSSDEKVFDSNFLNGSAGNLSTDKAKLITAEFDTLFGVEGLRPAACVKDADPKADEIESSGII